MTYDQTPQQALTYNQPSQQMEIAYNQQRPIQYITYDRPSQQQALVYNQPSQPLAIEYKKNNIPCTLCITPTYFNEYKKLEKHVERFHSDFNQTEKGTKRKK